MKDTADPLPSGPRPLRSTHIRALGVAVLLALTAFIAIDTPVTARLRAASFDAYQAMLPRSVHTMPVTIVAIDEKSLAAIGQWPWPRTKLAELVHAVHRDQPLAIALDIFMPEADALSPENVFEHRENLDPAVIEALDRLPKHDAVLAATLAADHAILVVAGTPEKSRTPLHATPVSVRDVSPGTAATANNALDVAQYQGALTSLDVIDNAAAGHGLVSVDPENGIIRRMPLVASIGGTLVPSLGLEMLRVALNAPSLRLRTRGSSVEGVSLGDVDIPTEHDGSVHVYFSPRNAERFVSAVDVLEGRVEPGRLKQQMALIALTGLGLIEFQNTPVGERMPGSEIHAQLLENIADHAFLRRPAAASLLEALAFLAAGALLVYATPRWKPQFSALITLGGVVLLEGMAFVAFRSQRLLLDGATPALCLVLLFCGLLVLTLAETRRQERALEQMVRAEREQSARISGELEAAQRIQTATLPRADLLAGDGRIALDATMIPARETGGDLYDFFRLPDDRLFFLVGDVAGKGLSASIFMAVSKALYKSATLRAPRADIGELMSVANSEVSRDNPEMLFVTAFAGILDLETGDLSYCNAGHENPYVLGPPGAALRRIGDGDGPPLCAVGGYVYRGAHRRLEPGQLLCVMTDGVTEARNRAGELYGSGRVRDVLQRFGDQMSMPDQVVAALRADVLAFAAGAEPTDDLTILALRWGSGAADSGRQG